MYTWTIKIATCHKMLSCWEVVTFHQVLYFLEKATTHLVHLLLVFAFPSQINTFVFVQVIS